MKMMMIKMIRMIIMTTTLTAEQKVSLTEQNKDEGK